MKINKLPSEDLLQIAFDNAQHRDQSCLIVARAQNEKLYIISEFFDNEATFIYEIVSKRKSIIEAITDFQNEVRR